jgi:hypothetical protein
MRNEEVFSPPRRQARPAKLMENRNFELRKRISGALIQGFLGALGVLAVQFLPIHAEFLKESSLV